MRFVSTQTLQSLPERLRKLKRQSASKAEPGGIYIEEWIDDVLTRDHGGQPSGPVATPTPVDPELAELSNIMAASHHDPTLMGNRVEVWAKKVGADKAAALWEQWTHVPCGCNWRQAILNDAHKMARGIFAKLRGVFA